MIALPAWLGFPPATPATVVHCKADKADVYIGRGSAYGNPFPMHAESDRDTVIAQFRAWIAAQPELLRLVRQALPGKRIGCFCAPRACHGDVLNEIAAGLWDHRIPDEPIFVFGSNLAGRHGAGAALGAKQEYGAVYGVGQGLTGHAYALPTKNGPYDTLPLERVLEEIDRFIELALRTPETQYRMTRIGCGLAGLPEDVIRERLLRAPANVLLPGIWEVERSPGLARVIVAGSRDIDDYPLVCDKLDRLLANLHDVENVTGGARGPDTLGERYAIERGLRLRRIPAFWDTLGKSAGNIRNRRMSWYGTHLVAFWDGQSTGTRNMIETAKRDELKARVVKA
jgi:hypothetical protein